MSSLFQRPLPANKIITKTVFLLALCLVFILPAACTNSPSPTTTPLGKAVSLAPGQAVTIEGESLKIKFAEVINDSRCPSGATCIWQGEVSCRLEITYRENAFIKVITQPGLSADPATAEFNGYTLRFKVQPYPTAGASIKSKDYRLQLTAEKE